MSKFIATGALNTNDSRNVDRTIYGVGNTADAAIKDAVKQTGNEATSFTATAATDELVQRVIAAGGDVRWSLNDDGLAAAEAR